MYDLNIVKTIIKRTFFYLLMKNNRLSLTKMVNIVIKST